MKAAAKLLHRHPNTLANWEHRTGRISAVQFLDAMELYGWRVVFKAGKPPSGAAEAPSGDDSSSG
jgi:hypothetical protein